MPHGVATTTLRDWTSPENSSMPEVSPCETHLKIRCSSFLLLRKLLNRFRHSGPQKRPRFESCGCAPFPHIAQPRSSKLESTERKAKSTGASPSSPDHNFSSASARYWRELRS